MEFQMKSLRVVALLTVVLAVAVDVSAQVYSQTSLAGSTGRTPGLYDQFGLLAGPNSHRRDFYEIFTNNTGQAVKINSAVLYGTVNTASIAAMVPVVSSR